MDNLFYTESPPSVTAASAAVPVIMILTGLLLAALVVRRSVKLFSLPFYSRGSSAQLLFVAISDT